VCAPALHSSTLAHRSGGDPRKMLNVDQDPMASDPGDLGRSVAVDFMLQRLLSVSSKMLNVDQGPAALDAGDLGREVPAA